MHDESSDGSAEIRHAGGGAEGSAREQSPLQARAAFLANWSWQSVIRHNQGACARGRAQHGTNSESAAAVGREWDEARQVESSLGETLDYLRTCHKRAPFLFFNGNTFADIARTFADYLFAELPPGRRRQATSAIAHYVAGVLDRDSMAAILRDLCEKADFKPGDRVRTLRGSTRGVIERLLDDGRVVWRPDGASSTLTSLPESLLWEPRGKKRRP